MKKESLWLLCKWQQHLKKVHKDAFPEFDRLLAPIIVVGHHLLHFGYILIFKRKGRWMSRQMTPTWDFWHVKRGVRLLLKGTPHLKDFKLKVVSSNPDECEFSALKSIWDFWKVKSFIMLTLLMKNYYEIDNLSIRNFLNLRSHLHT